MRRMDKGLETALLEEIAIRFPFSLEDVKITYTATGYSIDATVIICQSAAEKGLRSPLLLLPVAVPILEDIK